MSQAITLLIPNRHTQMGAMEVRKSVRWSKAFTDMCKELAVRISPAKNL